MTSDASSQSGIGRRRPAMSSSTAAAALPAMKNPLGSTTGVPGGDAGLGWLMRPAEGAPRMRRHLSVKHGVRG